MQKEFKELLDAIEKWAFVNKGKVAFIGTFVSIDQEKIEKRNDDINIVKDSVNIGFGFKEILEISLEGLQQLLKKNKKKNFISYIGKLNLTIKNYKRFDA